MEPLGHLPPNSITWFQGSRSGISLFFFFQVYSSKNQDISCVWSLFQSFILIYCEKNFGIAMHEDLRTLIIQFNFFKRMETPIFNLDGKRGISFFSWNNLGFIFLLWIVFLGHVMPFIMFLSPKGGIVLWNNNEEYLLEKSKKESLEMWMRINKGIHISKDDGIIPITSSMRNISLKGNLILRSY